MVSKLRFHIEGGRNKTQDVEMRRAFHVFFAELFQLGKGKCVGITFILHGGRKQAYEKFCYALGADSETYNVLLVDSEDPVKETGECWTHLKNRPDDNWDRPNNVNDDQCQLMVQAIEAWFFADSKSLGEYYGQGFQMNSLRKTSNVEDISKDKQISDLEAATRHTKKGLYHKYNHLPGILMKIDPAKVRQRAPHCNHIFSSLTRRMESDNWN